ncbi:hypothetical protein O181_094471 [Austropuccinia psidii MF-1]|uniref:Uncharacterized protein n=1 Tax=Austropuccinia psidii MF-1 TaxID=1389203 RepID=A0A9Q3J3A6_9BASI|nr:hypothetical protein [Austropuccinia psidii MF-1]
MTSLFCWEETFSTSRGSSFQSLVTGSRKRDVARWTNVEGPIPTGARTIYSGSEVLISRFNIQGLVKRLSRIADSPTNSDSEGSDELDGEEVEMVSKSIGHQSSISPSQPSSRIFQSQVVPSTPTNVQPVLSTTPSSIPPPSPNSSTARPALVLPVRKSPFPQPRNSPLVTSQQLKPVARSSRRRED